VMARTKLLFICKANVCRSRTAEDLFKNSTEYEVQSAGIRWHPNGGQVVSQGLIGWADKIFVMENWHLEYLAVTFDIEGKRITVLDTSDIYGRGDKNLIKILTSKLTELGIGIN